MSYDVAVVGGGPAGSVAAIQAARLGARTLLVEKNGILGGATTSAGINVPGLFHAWGKQVIAGIGWHLVNRAVQLAGDQLPDFARYDRPVNVLQVRVNPAIYAALLDDAVLGSGAALSLHTMLAAVHRRDSEWRLTLCGKEGLRAERARVLVDGTGDANAVTLAGYEPERNAELQPGTLNVTLSGYDPATLDYRLSIVPTKTRWSRARCCQPISPSTPTGCAPSCASEARIPCMSPGSTGARARAARRLRSPRAGR